MKKLAILIYLLIVAGCSTTRSNERPAASADGDSTQPLSAARSEYGSGNAEASTDFDRQRGVNPEVHDSTTNTTTANHTDKGTDLRNDSTVAGTDSVVTPVAPASDDSNRDKPARSDADNTRVNERDRSGSTLTPLDQGASPSDTKTTQRIRQAVVGDDSLSFTAKNVKIITINGKVTLRGPVNSARERAKVEATAKSVTGVTQIDNQLEIEN